VLAEFPFATVLTGSGTALLLHATIARIAANCSFDIMRTISNLPLFSSASSERPEEASKTDKNGSAAFRL
jgi:hypothetical protein